MFAAPVLKIEKSPPQSVRLSWAAAEPDWVLEGGANLLDFDTVLSAPQLEGNLIALTRPLSQPSYFWRLRAQKTSGIAGGRNFLRDSQGDSGVWGTATGTTILHSAAAVAALTELAGSDPAFSSAREFGLDALSYATTRNHDELARKVIAMAAGGRPVSSLVGELLGGQNPELPEETSLAYPGYAWGIAPALGGTTIDTALALRAIEAADTPGSGLGLSIVNETTPTGASSAAYPFTVPAGATGMFLLLRDVTGNARFSFAEPNSPGSYFTTGPVSELVRVNFGDPDPGDWSMTVSNLAGSPITYSAEVVFTTAEGFDVSRLTGAVSYLGLARNPDGGWGIGPGDDSHLLVTCEVMRALAGRGAWATSALDTAANWLNTKRNGDGGFSSDSGTSNTLETALAMLAIRLSGQPITLDSARAFLRSQQLLNGSWQEDPYTTALASQALAQPPVLAPIPNQNVVIPNLFTQIHLDNFVADPDHADSEITWSVGGQSQLSVAITNRVATISYPANTALTETLTFTATDPDGLATSTNSTFSTSLTPPFDYSIARGGFVTGTRSFTTTPENFARIAYFTESPQGVPAGVAYQTTSFSGTSPDRLNVDFQISADATAPPGIHSFTVEYGLLDATSNELVPLFNNIFNFTIQITP